MSLAEVKVPDIGDFEDVEVIEVLVKPGDPIRVEQSLVTVESDKASMEIPSAVAGVVREIKVKVGSKVSEGSILAVVESNESAAAPAAAPAAASPAPTVASAPSPSPRPASASASPAPAGATVEVKVPDIGDFKDVEVIEVLVKPGDVVGLEQSLITLESDKASMEIPSSSAGRIEALKVKVGDKVNEGSVIALIATAAAAPAAGRPPTSPPTSPATPSVAPAPSTMADAPKERRVPDEPARPIVAAPAGAGGVPHASPSVRKFARELGVALEAVKGSGPKGRILHEDIQNFVKEALSRPAAGAGTVAVGEGMVALGVLPWPKVDFAKFGPTESVALSRIKKLSGPNLARNWAMIPHVTQFDEADVTDLEAFRKSSNEALAKSGTKLTMLAFVMKACVAALQRYPSFNSSLDAQAGALVLKKYWHIGFAADTPQGLVVPVVRDCDKKGVIAIANEMGALAAKARDGKLSPADMQGSTFSISSLGGIGGTAFTPIINAPEVAILGLSRTEIKPRWDGKAFVPRLMLPLSLSYDHRAIDGADGARFTAYLAEVLADMRRVLL